MRKLFILYVLLFLIGCGGIFNDQQTKNEVINNGTTNDNNIDQIIEIEQKQVAINDDPIEISISPIVSFYTYDNMPVMYGEPLLTTGMNGNNNSAYSFNGIDDYIELPNYNFHSTTDPKTVLIWMKTNVANSKIYDDNVVEIGITPNGYLEAFSQGYRIDCHITDSIISDGQWHFVGVSLDLPNTNKIYLDGTLIQTCETQPGGHYKTPRIGQFNDGGHFYTGIIDNIMIYDHTLSDNDILTIYDKTKI